MRSLANQRVARQANVDIAEIRRLAEDGLQRRKIPVRIENGRYGFGLWECVMGIKKAIGFPITNISQMEEEIGFPRKDTKWIWDCEVVGENVRRLDRWRGRVPCD